jgi:hypothetical protein
MFFWIPWGIDLIAALAVIWFFFVGLGDGSVSSFNAGLWMLILAAVAGIVGGSWLLKESHPYWAIGLSMVLAVPSAIFGLWMLMIVISKPHWN